MNKKQLRKRIEELASKIKEGNINTLEQREFDDWYRLQAEKDFYIPEDFASNNAELKNRIYHRIEDKLEFDKKGRYHWIFNRNNLGAAAAVLIMLSFGVYFLLKTDRIANTVTISNQIPDLAPGKNRAILTLSDGEEIDLEASPQGQIAAEGNSFIHINGENEVIYKDRNVNQVKSPYRTNTMRTPRGATYRLKLADGTKVWLNAASSITYPTSFSDKTREVSISGEVYFEVAHDASRPFKVKTGDQMIQVLGTHFNVNSYNNEDVIRTTLVEGSVAISMGEFNHVLRPGDQARISNNGIKVGKVDTDEITAWKNGYFQFVDADIYTIMKQISRWYDVDIEFVGPMSKESFTGRISRDRNLNQVLQIVQNSKSVHLTFEGRRIMVRQ